MLAQATKALDVAAKDLQEFEMEDTSNGHLLRGYLCRRPDHRYGALYLTHVNGEEEAQLIFATPKLHYPFDRAGTYHFQPSSPLRNTTELRDGCDIVLPSAIVTLRSNSTVQ